MPKKVNLTVGERIYMTNILNEFKGNLESLSSALEDVKKIVLTSEEKEGIEYKLSSKEGGQVNITWDAEKAKKLEKELELSKTTTDYVFNILKQKDDKGEFTLADVGVMELKKKLAAL